MFEELIGNDHVKKALTKKLPSPLLFYGMEGVGKKTFAHAYFTNLLGKKLENHPDYRCFSPEGKSQIHTVARMHDLVKEMEMTPFNGARKCILIERADRLTETSANAILKTLEEHPSFVTIVLVTEVMEDLLPTVLSRCLKVPFHPAKPEEIAGFLKTHGQLSSAEIERVVALSHGSFGKALTLMEQGIGEGERLLRALLAKPSDRKLLDQIDKFVGDDRKLGMDLLILLSRLLKGKEELADRFLAADMAYRHHIRLSSVLESLLLTTA
jgi:DNA polymerase III subunit delta'